MGLSQALEDWRVYVPLLLIGGYAGGKLIEKKINVYAVNLGQLIREGRTSTDGGYSAVEMKIYKMLEGFDQRLNRIERRFPREVENV